ncbi:hypothetical protein GIB67_020795, partial [Kingdonia uniflora]
NYDADLLEIKYQFEGLDWMGRKLELRYHFYEKLFWEVIVEPSSRKEAIRLIAKEDIELDNVRFAGGELIRFVVEMKTFPMMEASTSGRSPSSDSIDSDRENNVGVVQFLYFPRQLVLYPLNSDVFREFCKSKALIG